MFYPATGPAPPTGVDTNGEVGSEFGYRGDLTLETVGANVIASVGIDAGLEDDIIGAKDIFPGGIIWTPHQDSPDGLAYGLLSSGDDPDTGNTPVTGDLPLIKYAVEITLKMTTVPSGPVENVSFNYGTGFNPANPIEPPEPGPVPIPAPTAAILGMIGLGMLGWWKRRTGKVAAA